MLQSYIYIIEYHLKHEYVATYKQNHFIIIELGKFYDKTERVRAGADHGFTTYL